MKIDSEMWVRILNHTLSIKVDQINRVIDPNIVNFIWKEIRAPIERNIGIRIGNSIDRNLLEISLKVQDPIESIIGSEIANRIDGKT